MSHFDVGDWTDYVRGIADGAAADEMTAHLGSGCTECAETYMWLNKVNTVANLSVKMTVPTQLVLRAESLFERPMEFDFGKLLPLGAQMVFDAGCVMHPMGIRSAGATDQALYEAGDFTIDLRQEKIRGSVQITLTGQISDGRNTNGDSGRFPVGLFAGKSVVSNVVSNAFGEFSMTYTRRPNMMLTIGIVETGRRIDIPLTTRTSRTNSS